MGYSSYLRGNHNDAERLLRDALHLKPSDKRATSNLALVVGKQGRTNEALDLLKKVGDESTALAALGYIHSERGEFALAEQRYQEALNLDPNLKEAKVALAQLAKQHPADSIVAESKPTDFDVRDFEDSANPVVKTTEIQQVSALAETATPLITTASFTEEWSEPSEPARLDEETRFPISTAQPADESWDDDWSHDESAKTNSAKESASEWDDNVKTNSDDEWPEYQEESSLTSSEAPLAFGPRRKPARNVASELLMESDGDFSAPSISKNRSK
jgi:tetratricopeptide (TPR) repeat protein